jgi:hypothetical protein
MEWGLGKCECKFGLKNDSRARKYGKHDAILAVLPFVVQGFFVDECILYVFKHS